MSMPWWRERYCGSATACGSLRKLLRASPERHLWADSYQGDLTDVFSLQDRNRTIDCARGPGRTDPGGASPLDQHPARGPGSLTMPMFAAATTRRK